MSRLSVNTQVNNDTARTSISVSSVNPRIKELQAEIQSLKDQKSECLGRVRRLEANIDESYERINYIRESLRHVGFEIGNAKADLSINREKMNTLRQAKMEKEAKAQFGEIVENAQKLIDSLYEKREILRTEMNEIQENIPAIKEEIRWAYDDLTDAKFALNRAYMEYNRIKPKVVYNDSANETDELPKRKRSYGKPPGGNRKSRFGH